MGSFEPKDTNPMRLPLVAPTRGPPESPLQADRSGDALEAHITRDVFLPKMLLETESVCFVSSLSFDGPPRNSETEVMKALHEDKTDDDGLLTALHPRAFAEKANAEDTPNFHQAMNGPHSKGFLKAMELELDQLEFMKSPSVPVNLSIFHCPRVCETCYLFEI
jgi:hypothetical protein